MLLTLPVKTACEEQPDKIIVQFLIQVLISNIKYISIPLRSLEKFTHRLCYEWVSQGVELLTQVEKAQEGQNVTRTLLLRLGNFVYADGGPISFLYLSYLKKYCHMRKGRSDTPQQCKNTSHQSIFSSSLYLRRWEGKWSLYIHS